MSKDKLEAEELHRAIDRVLTSIADDNMTPKDRAALIDQVAVLYKLREPQVPQRISPDTLALIAGNLAGIVLIISYERAHVVTSKALSFVLKLR